MVAVPIATLGEVDPHVAVADLNRISRDVVGPLVERSPRLQIESGMVPMACQDSIADAPAIEWKAHMRTSIVDGKDPAAMVGVRLPTRSVADDRQRVTSDLCHNAPTRWQIGEGRCPNPLFCRPRRLNGRLMRCHIRSPGSPRCLETSCNSRIDRLFLQVIVWKISEPFYSGRQKYVK